MDTRDFACLGPSPNRPDGLGFEPETGGSCAEKNLEPRSITKGSLAFGFVHLRSFVVKALASTDGGREESLEDFVGKKAAARRETNRFHVFFQQTVGDEIRDRWAQVVE